MTTLIGLVLAAGLVGAARHLGRRRGDVLDHHRTSTQGTRVGTRWVRSRHGGR